VWEVKNHLPDIGGDSYEKSYEKQETKLFEITYNNFECSKWVWINNYCYFLVYEV